MSNGESESGFGGVLVNGGPSDSETQPVNIVRGPNYQTHDGLEPAPSDLDLLEVTSVENQGHWRFFVNNLEQLKSVSAGQCPWTSFA